MSELGKIALELAARGYHVFPLRPRSKEPATARGFKDATRDERQILHWWDKKPDANIGIACGASGIVVLDIDPKAGADPEDVLGELELEGAVVVRTGWAPERSEQYPSSLPDVRGAHVYFRGDLPTGPTKIPGVEIRGARAYVVAPGSVHPSGAVYEGDLPAVTELLTTPAWLLELQGPNGARAPKLEEKIPAGSRNATLMSIAGTMRRRGTSVDAINAALQVENGARCEPPLEELEVRRIAESAGRYPPAAAGAGGTRDELEYDARTGKLVLPPVPELGDVAGLCAWLTTVFALDPMHPITGGERKGARGPDGRVELTRASAGLIRFEPARHVNTPMRLIEALGHQELPTDGKVPAFKAEHCQDIAFAIRRLCGTSETISDEDEAAGIVGTFTMVASAVEGHTTYGTPGQRYDAAMALRRAVDEMSGRAVGPPHYLVDANTGEYVIAVSDLQEAGRRHVGSSLPRGWLDGRMDALGWRRITLEGHALPGRDGRIGPHARIYAYRGLLPHGDDR